MLRQGVQHPVVKIFLYLTATTADQAERVGRFCFVTAAVFCPHDTAQQRRVAEHPGDMEAVEKVEEKGGIFVGDAPFINKNGAAQRKRPIKAVGVAGDPCQIGGTPENIAIIHIEQQLGGKLRPHQKACGAVDNRFGGFCFRYGVEHKQRIIGVANGINFGILGIFVVGDQVLIPEIAFGLHVNPFAGSFNNNTMFNLVIDFT